MYIRFLLPFYSSKVLHLTKTERKKYENFTSQSAVENIRVFNEESLTNRRIQKFA
jgi:hypothetical protein